MSGPRVLSARELNRALLQRQGLLERSTTPAIDMLEQLVGMQAQEPLNPYVALWSRLREFEAEQLSALVEAREAVRAQLMRATIHIVSARDVLALHPLALPVQRRALRGQFTKVLGGADVDEVAAAGRDLLTHEPRTRAELAKLLAPRWPGADPAALAQAVTFNNALVQVTPRGLWGRTGQARWSLTESWLGRAPDTGTTPDEVVLRYLAAFGPAASADVRTWSGFTGLREVLERLRPQLQVFRDERGRELFDVPGAPLPDPGTPAPPRFLPEYDNLLLSHADRSRVLAGLGPGLPFPTGRWIGNLLVDGFFRAYWKIEDARLSVDRFTPHPSDPPGTVDDVVAEGERLLGFVAPDASERRVRFDPEP